MMMVLRLVQSSMFVPILYLLLCIFVVLTSALLSCGVVGFFIE